MAAGDRTGAIASVRTGATELPGPEVLRKPLGLVLVAAGGAAAGVLAARTPAPAAMAGALALIGVALALTRPGVALYAIGGLALTVPYAVVPARAGVQPPILDIIIILTLAATVAWAVRTRQPLGPSWLIALVAAGVLLPLAAGLNAWAAAREVEAAQRAVKLAIAAALPLAGTFWMRPDSAVRHVPALVAWIATAQAIAALVLHVAGAEGIQALTAIGPAGYPVEEVARYLPDQTTPRATGLLVDPNVLGVTLAACVPFVFAWMSGPRWCRWAGTGVLVLISAALAASLSRGGWLAAAAAALVWLAWRRPRVAAGLALAAAAVIAAPIPIEPLEHLRSGFLARDAAAALRLDELREAVRVIGRYPWLGVGYGDPPHPDLFAGVSNASLWVAERAGVAAAVLGLATLFGGFWSAARTARDNSLARALTSSLIAIAVAGLLDHHVASFPHLVALVGLLVGLAAGLTPRRPSAL